MFYSTLLLAYTDGGDGTSGSAQQVLGRPTHSSFPFRHVECRETGRSASTFEPSNLHPASKEHDTSIPRSLWTFRGPTRFRHARHGNDLTPAAEIRRAVFRTTNARRRTADPPAGIVANDRYLARDGLPVYGRWQATEAYQTLAALFCLEGFRHQRLVGAPSSGVTPKRGAPLLSPNWRAEAANWCSVSMT